LERKNKSPSQLIVISIRRDGEWTDLPPFPGSDLFLLCGIPRASHGIVRPKVVAGDIRGSGAEDLVVLGACQSGLASGSGTVLLPIVGVYRNLGKWNFEADEQLSQRLNDNPVGACLSGNCDLLAIAKRAARH
jgi:hypothetical protein